MAMLAVQTPIEIRSEFDGAWLNGFQVVEAIETPVRAYRVRRRSDRFVLPRLFPPSRIRRQRQLFA